MAYDKLIDSAKLDAAMNATADAIRAKTGDTTDIPWDESAGFSRAIAAIVTGTIGANIEIGSFVPSADVQYFTIAHSLGVTPKMAFFVADSQYPPEDTSGEDENGNAVNYKYLGFAFESDNTDENIVAGYGGNGNMGINSNRVRRKMTEVMDHANYSEWIGYGYAFDSANAETICCFAGYYGRFKAGLRYMYILVGEQI